MAIVFKQYEMQLRFSCCCICFIWASFIPLFFIAFSQFLRRKKTIAKSYTDKAKQMPITEKEKERENSIPVMRFIDYIHTNVFSNE